MLPLLPMRGCLSPRASASVGTPRTAISLARKAQHKQARATASGLSPAELGSGGGRLMVGSARATPGARAQGLGSGALSPLLRSQPRSSEPLGSEPARHTQCTSTRASEPQSAACELPLSPLLPSHNTRSSRRKHSHHGSSRNHCHSLTGVNSV